jgi:arylsulfatase A-like enzyme
MDNMKISKAGLAGTTFLTLCATPVVGAPADRPNILFILVDDMGWREPGCYGHPTMQTPNIDRLASEGVRFTHMQVYPMCSPTRAALLTGRHGYRTGIINNIGDKGGVGQRVELEEITIAEALKPAGYRTGFFGKTHLTFDNRGEPDYINKQGFDENFGFVGLRADEMPPGEKGNGDSTAAGTLYFRWDIPFYHNGQPVAMSPESRKYSDDVITSEAVNFITNTSKQPFLAWVSMYLVHAPHEIETDYLEKIPMDDTLRQEFAEIIRLNHIFAKDFSQPGLAKWSVDNVGLLEKYRTYKAMVMRTDDQVGRLLDALDKAGVAENTLIVFMSDNGPHPIAGGGKAAVIDAGTRVPLIMRWPGQIRPGIVSDALAMSVDIYPTLVEAASAQMPEGIIFDGKSLLPVLRGEVGKVHDYTYSEKKGWMGFSDHDWYYATFAGTKNKDKFYRRLTPPDVSQSAEDIKNVPLDVKEKFQKWADEVRAIREETLRPYLEQLKNNPHSGKGGEISQ